MARGFSLIEAMAVAALAGVALGGVVGLVTATQRAGGEGELRLRARLGATGALEQGTAKPPEGPLRVDYRAGGGRREARAVWPGGFLDLAVWTGHD